MTPPKTIHEPARDIPLVGHFDLCVVGGSTTGVFAALAAARLGLRVAIVETLGLFGGTATASMVCVWHSVLDTSYETTIAAGLPMELIERLQRLGTVTEREKSPEWQFCFNPAEMAIELDRMIVEAQVRPFLHTRFVAPVVDEPGHVTHVIIEDKTGRRAIAADMFIDASGDADLAHRSQMECYKQPHLQPPTACVMLEGMSGIYERNPDFSYPDALFDPQYPEALRPGFAWGARMPAMRDLNMIAGTRVHGADCSDADQLTQAEIEGRRQIRCISQLLRHRIPGGERVQTVAIPARIGIRHSRQVRCLHQLTEHEVLHGVRFDDAIANGSYRVDVHSGTGGGLIFRYLDGREVEMGPGIRGERRWAAEDEATATFYQIPYRSLVPLGSRNVLVAGRCLDADEGAFGAVRVMINCSQTGHATGVAAALALDRRIDVPDVPAGDLRQALRDQGAVVL